MEKHGTWILLVDFNTVRHHDERTNSMFCLSFAFYFNRFIGDASLHDIRIGGHRFTYFCQSEPKLSNLDRFLICSNFHRLFPTVFVTALPCDLSDHYQIILRTGWQDFGRPPFRFFNS